MAKPPRVYYESAPFCVLGADADTIAAFIQREFAHFLALVEAQVGIVESNFHLGVDSTADHSHIWLVFEYPDPHHGAGREGASHGPVPPAPRDRHH